MDLLSQNTFPGYAGRLGPSSGVKDRSSTVIYALVLVLVCSLHGILQPVGLSSTSLQCSPGAMAFRKSALKIDCAISATWKVLSCLFDKTNFVCIMVCRLIGIGLPFAARSLSVPLRLFVSHVGGITLTYAPVSTRNQC